MAYDRGQVRIPCNDRESLLDQKLYFSCWLSTSFVFNCLLIKISLISIQLSFASPPLAHIECPIGSPDREDHNKSWPSLRVVAHLAAPRCLGAQVVLFAAVCDVLPLGPAAVEVVVWCYPPEAMLTDCSPSSSPSIILTVVATPFAGDASGALGTVP
jgi:hypothetical protein